MAEWLEDYVAAIGPFKLNSGLVDRFSVEKVGEWCVEC
jgi:hypothetical protein